MNQRVSVIICAHNSRSDYLRRVVDGLKSQTLPVSRWELIFVDNASTEPLANSIPIGWHPGGRHVREDQLGLTSARLRGIRESKGQLLVFVDDDNVLGRTYLQSAVEIASAYPFIGAFGGSISGEFEVPPPRWLKRDHQMRLGICAIDRDYWSNSPVWSLATPFGAGMCVRRTVAEDYARKLAANPFRRSLGRTGSAMMAGEDLDLAWCAVDLGMGTGRFRALTMTHLISKRRLTWGYFTHLSAGIAASNVILKSLRGDANPSQVSWWRQIVRSGVAIAGTPWRELGVTLAILRAQREARFLLAKSRLNRQSPAHRA